MADDTSFVSSVGMHKLLSLFNKDPRYAYVLTRECPPNQQGLSSSLASALLDIAQATNTLSATFKAVFSAEFGRRPPVPTRRGSVTAIASPSPSESRRLLTSGGVAAVMFVELCKQKAGEFMQELLKPLFNTIFRASDDSLVSPDLFDKLRDLFITLLNSSDVLAKLDDQVRQVMRCAVAAAEVNDIQPFEALSSLFLGVLVHTALSEPHTFSLLSPGQTLSDNAKQLLEAMVDVLELLYNNAADKVSPRLMPTQDQRDMVKLALHSMAVGDDDSMNFTPPGSYDQNPKDRTVVAFRDAFVALKPQLLNDVHRVKFSWYSPQAMDDEFELVIRDLDSGKSVSAGAALADTGVDPMFLSVFEWLTMSSEVADISRRVDLEDVAEESKKLPIKAISLEQATKSLEAPLESLVTLEKSSSPIACLVTFVADTQQLRVTASSGSAFGQVLFEGDLKTAIAVVGGHYPNAWNGVRCHEDLLFRRMRFAVLWEKQTLAIEAVTRDAQELWVTNLNAVMQLQRVVAQ